MIRWLKASLYRKLILSHVGVLLFLFVLGMSIGGIAYRVHLLDLFQQRFQGQTRIMFNHMKEEMDAIRSQLHSEGILPTQSRSGLQKAFGSNDKHTLNLLATSCKRVQESSVVLSALVTVANEDNSCLMEARPWKFQIYWPHKKELLPKACQRLLSPISKPKELSSANKAHPNVALVTKKQPCRSLQRRKKRWSKRRKVLAQYKYQMSTSRHFVVTYILIPRLHRPGPLPLFWIAFLVLLTVGIGLLTAPISRSITRPLQELMQAVRQIQGGDLTQEVSRRSHDEVGELAGAVEEMRSSLLLGRQQRRALIADISHEIRTPLSRIRVVGESVADGLMREPERLTQAMEGICKQVDEIDQLIGDLFDIAKMELSDPEQLTFQSIQLDQLLQEMKRTLDPAALAAKKQLVVAGMTKDLPSVKADFRRLRQVLNNLVQNAIRYSPEGGTITLSAFQEDNWLRCEVIDQGAGVPEEEREKIFERLYRTDTSRSRLTGGQGLGLAIVKQIIVAHHGEVGVNNTDEGGARFWFKLPL